MTADTTPGSPNEGTDRFVSFIIERHRVYLRRAAGEPWPWTQDPVLQTYRFCNVYRELDTVTAWLRENWFSPHENDRDVWFASAVARHVNKVDTLARLGYPLTWDGGWFRKHILNVMSMKVSAYSGAYMISMRGKKGDLKHDYLADQVLGPMWENKEELRYRRGETLEDWHTRLEGCHGMGSFMAAQVVADAKFCGEAKGAPDWWTFASPGPGSQRGLNRVLGRPVNAAWKREAWRAELEPLRLVVSLVTQDYGWPSVSAQDLQNCLCEFSKYEKARLGEGRPKQLFRRTT